MFDHLHNFPQETKGLLKVKQFLANLTNLHFNKSTRIELEMCNPQIDPGYNFERE